MTDKRDAVTRASIILDDYLAPSHKGHQNDERLRKAIGLLEDALEPRGDGPRTVREVKLAGARLTVHLPLDHGNMHDAIREALGARHIDAYKVEDAYEVEEY